MNDPIHISVGKEEEVVVPTISHYYAISNFNFKFATLLAYIKHYNPTKAIIFARTKFAADMVHDSLENQGLNAMRIHGGLSQAKRESELKEFRNNGTYLIATNIVARGIDIKGISDVINFDAPDDAAVYVHRVGRSARMEAKGRAFTIITNDQRRLVRDIEHFNNIKMAGIELDIEPFRHAKLARNRVEREERDENFHQRPHQHQRQSSDRGQRRPFGNRNQRGRFNRRRR